MKRFVFFLIALLLLTLFLSGYFVTLMEWVMRITGGFIQIAFPFSSTLLSILILKYFSRFSRSFIGLFLISCILIAETVFFRAFILAFLKPFFIFLAFLLLCTFMYVMRLKNDRPLHKLVKALLIFYGAMPFVALFPMAVAYRGTHDCERLLKNKKINPVFTFCSPSWRKKIFQKTGDTFLQNGHYDAQARAMFISSDGKIVFVTTGLEDSNKMEYLMAIERSSYKILKVFKIHTVFRGICDFGKCVITVPPEKSIYILDENKLAFIKKITVPFKPRFLALDDVSHNVFLTGMADEELGSVNLENNSFLLLYYFHHSFSPLSKNFEWNPAPASGAVYNTINGILYAISERYFGIPCLYFFKKRQPKPYSKVFKSCFSPADALKNLGASFGISVAPERKEVFMAFPFEGSLYVLTEENYTLLKKIKLDMGTRELAYDPRRHLIYAANFLTGYIHVISAPERKTIGRIFVGRKIRQLTYEPRIDRILVTNSNGFLEVQQK